MERCSRRLASRPSRGPMAEKWAQVAVAAAEEEVGRRRSPGLIELSNYISSLEKAARDNKRQQGSRRHPAQAARRRAGAPAAPAAGLGAGGGPSGGGAGIGAGAGGVIRGAAIGLAQRPWRNQRRPTMAAMAVAAMAVAAKATLVALPPPSTPAVSLCRDASARTDRTAAAAHHHTPLTHRSMHLGWSRLFLIRTVLAHAAGRRWQRHGGGGMTPCTPTIHANEPAVARSGSAGALSSPGRRRDRPSKSFVPARSRRHFNRPRAGRRRGVGKAGERGGVQAVDVATAPAATAAAARGNARMTVAIESTAHWTSTVLKLWCLVSRHSSVSHSLGTSCKHFTVLDTVLGSRCGPLHGSLCLRSDRKLSHCSASPRRERAYTKASLYAQNSERVVYRPFTRHP